MDGFAFNDWATQVLKDLEEIGIDMELAEIEQQSTENFKVRCSVACKTSPQTAGKVTYL